MHHLTEGIKVEVHLTDHHLHLVNLNLQRGMQGGTIQGDILHKKEITKLRQSQILT